MTVSEAIKRLKKLPQDMEMYIEVLGDYNSYYQPLGAFLTDETFIVSDDDKTGSKGSMITIGYHITKPKKGDSKKKKKRYEYLINLPKVVTMY